MTADNIRKILIDSVSKTGGHLASSLGAVELAIALYEEFDARKDRIIWDVGHQAYAWKILTDRSDKFSTLRKFGGLSGFPNPSESPCDAAIAGHAGVAISVAEGYAAARDLAKGCEHIIAVVGDAALANGTSLEALNTASSINSKIIIIINDNRMSISKPIGACSRFLGRIIAGARYNKIKDIAKSAEKKIFSHFLSRTIRAIKFFFKTILVENTPIERLGFRYLGPIDGHNIGALKTALNVAKREERSVILHILTKKGQGFEPAITNPTFWHGVGAFDPSEALAGKLTSAPSNTWSDIFGETIVNAAAKDARIVALTAAMKDGTGLTNFALKYPSRFYDLGISEGHMVSFAAGLASGGFIPVVAIYSTFLQRAIDHVMHDVCISNLPVIFCVDRAGIVGADGVTHQGVFDIALLRAFPNLTICQPKDAEDFEKLFAEALARKGPTVIRYPRGVAIKKCELPKVDEEAKIAIWATGDYIEKAKEVATRLTSATVIHARYLKPFDENLLAKQRASGTKIVSIENGSIQGGFGEAIGADIKFGWPNEFIPHGTCLELERAYGLDVESIVAKLQTLNF